MFPISMITGDPLWNSLPAAKIINYPLEKADYKPYAQARLCVSNDDLYIQLLAFEVDPENQYYESQNGLLMSKGGAKTVSCPSGLEGEVFVPEGTLVIDDWTFRYAGKVTKIHIPSSVVTIGSVNFEEEFIHGDDGSITGKVYNVTICCKPGSYAYKFAQENGIPVIFD